MASALINRIIPSHRGMFGELLIEGNHVCFTVERPWVNNTPFKSCVPPGEYELIWHDSLRWGNRLHLQGEHVSIRKSHKARWACLLHPANFPTEVEGCVAPNEEIRLTELTWRGVSSRDALAKLEDHFPKGANHTLVILGREEPRDGFER